MLSQCLYECSEPVVVDNWLSGGRSIEVHCVDHALKPRVLPGDRPHGVSERLSESSGRQCDRRPPALGREVEADQPMVLVDDLPCRLQVTHLVGDTLYLVVEDV